MTKLLQLTTFLTCIFLVSCGGKKEQIVGTWHLNQHANGATITGDTTYQKNGTATFVGTLSGQGQEIYIIGGSSWEISGDDLTETITSSNTPQLVPVGLTTVSKIIELTSSTMVIEQNGTRMTYTKK